jgi:YHS domain-containing protein
MRFCAVTTLSSGLDLLTWGVRTPRTITDPVCRMQVADDGAAATVAHEGVAYRFCSSECARLFSDAPSLDVGMAEA